MRATHEHSGCANLGDRKFRDRFEVVDESLVELAQANGIKVILASVLPAAAFPWNKALKPAEKIVAINRSLQAYAIQKNLIYVDYFAAMVDTQNGLRLTYSEDGVHPNQAGYEVMERLVTQAIDKALMPPK